MIEIGTIIFTILIVNRKKKDHDLNGQWKFQETANGARGMKINGTKFSEYKFGTSLFLTVIMNFTINM